MGTGPALVISSTVCNEIVDESTVLVALVVEHATDEGFCVDFGECLRRVDTQMLTNANTMLFKILATPER